jgi:translocation and assembly module TamB
VIARVLVWIGLLAATLLMLAAAALQTAWLRDRVLDTALGAAADAHAIGEVRGRLLSDLELRDVELERDGTRIRIRALDLRVDVARLLLGEAALVHLRVDGTVVDLAPSDDAEPAGGDPTELALTAPVPVRVTALRITDLSLRRAGERLVHLARLEAGVRLRGADLTAEFAALRLSEPDVDAHGTLALTLEPGIPLRADLDVDAGLPAPSPLRAASGDVADDRLRAQIDLDGSLRALSAEVRTAAPVDARLRLEDGDVRAPGGRIDLSLATPARLGDLRVRRLHLVGGGTPADHDASLEATVEGLPGWPEGAPPVHVRARGTGDGGRLEIAELVIEDGVDRVLARGRLDLGAGRFEATADTEAFDVARWVPGWPSRIDATVSARGTLDPLSVAVDAARLEGRWNDRPANAVARFAWNATATPALDVETLSVAIGANRIEARTTDEARLAATVDAPRLAALWPGLAGALSGSADFGGTPERPSVGLDLSGTGIAWQGTSVERLDLRGRFDAEAPGATRLDASAEALRDARLPTTVTRLAAHVDAVAGGLRGRLDATGPDGRLALEGRRLADDPGALLVDVLDASLPLVGAVRLTDTPWRLEPDAAEAVDFAATCLAVADGRLCLEPGRLSASDARVRARAEGLALAPLAPLLPPDLVVEGAVSGTIEVDGRRGVVDLGADGTRVALLGGAGPLLETRLDRARLEGRLEDGRIDGRVTLDAGERGRATADGGFPLDGGPLAPSATLDARVDALALAPVSAFLPEGLALDGRLSATARWRDGVLDLDADARDATLAVLDADRDAIFEDRFDTLSLETRREGGRTRVHLEVAARTAGRATVRGTVTESGDAAPGVDATVELALDDLAPLGPLVPTLARPTGELDGTLRVTGPLADLRTDGRLEGRLLAGIPALGVRLDPLVVRLTGTGAEDLGFDAEARIGGETLTAAGRFDLRPDGVHVAATVSGDRIPLLALEDASATVSPELDLRLDGRTARVRGRVDVPRASVVFQRLPEGSDTLSRDVVIHSPDRAGAADGPLELDPDVTIDVGPDVRVSAAGAHATLEGSLDVRQAPGEALTARGRIVSTSGDVSRYGETLELRHGRVAFDGPVDNPSVDVLAARTVEQYEVGLRVNGYLDSLRTRLYSAPPTDDARTLTMLVSGRAPGQATQADLARAEQAALGLGLGGAASVLGRLTERLGIDEFGVESPMDEESGAVVVGKEITEGLYARYTYGLHSRSGGVVLEYRVTDSISIRSETGLTQAVDVLFRREFD